MNPITPEIQEIINQTINSAFYKIGLWWFLAVLLVAILLYLAIQLYIARRFKKYESDLVKAKTKDIEVWKQQKELIFSFVKFLEEKVFNNPALKEESKDVCAELNAYYGQLYLVMETNILNKINECIQGTTSSVQRFYLYKELRKQLMEALHEKLEETDYPFIKGNVNKAIVIRNGEKGLAKDMDELKEQYPFVEKFDDGYKTIPHFSAETEDNKK